MKYATIYFPTFGLEMNPGYKFDVGPFSFYYYGIIIALGIILAVIYGLRRAQQFGLKQDDILDGVLFIVPLSIICARIYYCIFSWEEYAANPIEVLYIWNGGLAIYGGVIGAALCIVAYCKIKKISLGAVLDVVSLGFLIGQSIGRWGNFFNREAFGVPTDFFLRMGLEDTRTGTMTFYHPTFLYESLWNAVGFVLLHILSKRRKYDGQIALGYVAWYGLGRTFIEGLRTDSLYWGDFRVSQVLAAVSCVTAVVILVLQAFKQHDPAKLFANVRAGEFALPEEAEVAAEETAEEAEEATEETEDVAEGTEEAAEETEEIEEAIEEPATEAEAVSEEPAQEN